MSLKLTLSIRPFSYAQISMMEKLRRASVCESTKESVKERRNGIGWNKSEGYRHSGAKGETRKKKRRVFWPSVGSRSGAMCSVSSCSNLSLVLRFVLLRTLGFPRSKHSARNDREQPHSTLAYVKRVCTRRSKLLSRFIVHGNAESRFQKD